MAEPASRFGRTGDGRSVAGGERSGGSPAGPRAVFEEPRRATAGGVAEHAGVTWERVDAENGVLRPYPRWTGQARRGSSKHTLLAP
ncbi:hypothetical protein Cme02nite_16100 [Catellatospora methionotrophica]|uniref:Uncharacterized protein n=1 Tax=Catellatospora methionotrophica TaxID=121620 RepID=A0A8J3PEF0_9ACTN|nr:hypothetical protein Cme02nite_16100 [Catellatospora methionotrophica]